MSLFQKILVPIDFSPHSSAALRMASELARGFDAALCLVHVYDLVPYNPVPENLPLFDAGQLEQIRQELAKRLEAAKSEALRGGLTKVEALLVQGQPDTEIVRAAETQGASLIVMGTHGRGGLAHLLLGSVAEKVVRKAACPVMTVPLKRESAREK